MTFSSTMRNFFILTGIITIILTLFIMKEMVLGESGVLSYPAGVFIGEQLYTLEYAITSDEQSRGLGEREQLCETCAMAFPFAVPGKYAIWMKGMRFPLDIVWISQENRVVHIERAVAPESKRTYTPGNVASMVLEFNAGALETIAIDDRLEFFSPQPEK